MSTVLLPDAVLPVAEELLEQPAAASAATAATASAGASPFAFKIGILSLINP